MTSRLRSCTCGGDHGQWLEPEPFETDEKGQPMIRVGNRSFSRSRRGMAAALKHHDKTGAHIEFPESVFSGLPEPQPPQGEVMQGVIKDRLAERRAQANAAGQPKEKKS